MTENDIKQIFARNIKRLRSQRGMTQEQLGEQLGLGKTTISQWEKAQKLPNAGSMEKVAGFFRIPKSMLFEESNLSQDVIHTTGQLARLPIVGKISCGEGTINYDEIEGYEMTPQDWLNGGKYFYVRAQGDSMTGARIHDGDLVLIREQPQVEDGEIAAVLIEDAVYLKRAYLQGESVILQSENPAYPPIVVDRTDSRACRIIGKLKKVVINF